jgi:hypothetical protein
MSNGNDTAEMISTPVSGDAEVEEVYNAQKKSWLANLLLPSLDYHCV